MQNAMIEDKRDNHAVIYVAKNIFVILSFVWISWCFTDNRFS